MKCAATCAAAVLCASTSHAAVAITELPARDADGPVTVFYPSDALPSPVVHGSLTIVAAPEAPMSPGNGHLIVISHGSGGSAWTYADLASALVAAGFVVAMPEHRGDNWHDLRDAGPVSWTSRPAEISRAIDSVSRSPRFAGLDFVHVGLYGMSAGEHLVELRGGGHGAYLSPFPSRLQGLEATLLADPPGYDHAAGTAVVDTAVVSFFRRHLLAGDGGHDAPVPARAEWPDHAEPLQVTAER